MSFVGPRPERPEFVESLSKEIPFYGVRHMVRPGLTGWAQIRYKYGSTVAGRAREAAVRLVLYQERLDRAGPADHVSDDQDGIVAPGRAMKWVFWIAVATIGIRVPGVRGVVVVAQPLGAASQFDEARQSRRCRRSWWYAMKRQCIGRKIENLLTLDYPAELLEVVVVSDGSNDGTAAILKSLRRQRPGQDVVKTGVAGQGAGSE